jgi:Fur family ferric uptake transcriptional regulator
MKEKSVKISRATIYRTLELLVKSGMVRRVHLGEDHYHYEHVRGDSHHDHLICTMCGAVIEFHDESLEARQREICARKKFTPTFHNLQILGVCDSCHRKGEQPDAPDRVQMIGANAMLLRK